MFGLLRISRMVAAMAGVALGLTLAAPAHADGQVTVRNSSGQAAIDPTYQTTLTVSGRGFQSIKKGHGGIYVQFGAVRGQWRPSQGGVSGQNYFIVPDSEAKAYEIARAAATNPPLSNFAICSAISHVQNMSALDAAYMESVVAGVVNTQPASRGRLAAFADKSAARVRPNDT